MRCTFSYIFGSILLSLLVGVNFAVALPFNDDMHHTRYLRTGSSQRMKPPGTVARGSLESRVENKQEAETLKNPVPADEISLINGERLFAVNCSPCHGTYTDSGRVMSPIVGMAFAPDLSVQMYKDRPDGNLYGTIHFGGLAVMPAYGYKLSATEHWDIINYIRKIQKIK